MPNPLNEMTNEQLVDAATPDTKYEFMRRQTIAAQQTAKYTRQNAHYLLTSVVVLALSSVGTFILACLR
jgi:hypothetical protein